MSSENHRFTEIKQHLLKEVTRVSGKNGTMNQSKVLPFRPDPTPCPGDTFAPRELSGLPVEVVVVERDPKDVRRLGVALLDDYPQIGSTDVELHLGEPRRIANIRCDLSTWLDVSRLPVESRTGILPLKGLAEIQKKRQAIEEGDIQASLYEEEVDGDLDYRRWKEETLGEALSYLEKTASLEKNVPNPTPQKTFPKSWTPHLSRIVAAAVLLFGVFFGVRQMDELHRQIVTQSQQIETQSQQLAVLENNEHQLTEKLEASQQGLTEKSQALSERDRQVANLENRVQALVSKDPEPNLPFAFLTYGTGTGVRGEHTLVVPEDATRVALVYEVVDPEPYSHYGLRITDQRSGKEIWFHDHMQRKGSVVSLGLPASLLASGDYMVVLSGYRKGTETPLKESFLLHVRRPGER